jgi:hypothetical protein
MIVQVIKRSTLKYNIPIIKAMLHTVGGGGDFSLLPVLVVVTT